MIDFVFFIIFIILFFISLLTNFMLINKNRKIQHESVQMFINLKILIEDLQKELNEKELSSVSQSEGFLKFVSDSRDMAFEYIENVQDGIKNFISSVDKDIKHFDEFGDVIFTPLTDSMKRISSAYKELKELLPPDYDRIDT